MPYACFVSKKTPVTLESKKLKGQIKYQPILHMIDQNIDRLLYDILETIEVTNNKLYLIIRFVVLQTFEENIRTSTNIDIITLTVFLCYVQTYLCT